ncbi:hypothetical protein EWM64_g1087 [Hericium alpestre]|uniref:Prolyl endopeptidase n=1 Tax=Hericium alpestre TaxID=135208 RepID=A0A4Z0AAE2_9AGAM|nr:hypothetical protein EWM64_g1087 [Hericium alpestre]
MSATPWVANQYPTARRSDHLDVYKSEKNGSVNVHDPYEWLEHNTPETEDWVTAQEAYTRKYLDANPDRQRLEDEIRKSSDYEKFSAPSLKKDGRWYWYYNSGLQPQSVLYRSKDSTLPQFERGATVQAPNPGGEIFFDPNALSKDGTVSIQTSAFSKDGKHYAYAVSRSGSDSVTVYVRSTDQPFTSLDNDRFPERESHGAADSDKAGTETDSDKNAMLYYHRLNTDQSEDILVINTPDQPLWMFAADCSEDGRWLMLYIHKDTSRKNLLWIADLHENTIGPNIKWIKLVDEYEWNYSVVENDDSKLYIFTNADAPRAKLITVDLDEFIKSGTGKITDVEKVLVAEKPDSLLEGASIVAQNRLMLSYKRNVQDELYVYSLETGTQLKRLVPEHVGSVSFGGRRDQDWIFVQVDGFTSPGTVSKYEFTEGAEGTMAVWRDTVVRGLAGQPGFVAEQVWYESKDGTKIPMFVVRHESTPLDGTAPAIQYGYGGFKISLDPFFSPTFLTFLRAYGAIFAMPNIRGGGEFGDEWHQAGTRERKVNCFDDFTAATDWLVKNKYAGKGKIAINGGSNGGLLVSASVLRAPEGTFGAAVAEVGVHDLLKFNKFTIGIAWTSDYGNPDDPHDFDFIYPISPVHNVPSNKLLPPTILLTADHDDRVVPLHSFKFAATLQHNLPKNPNPLLIRIEKKAGHGAGKSTEQRIKEAADKWGFVAQSLGLQWSSKA